MTHVKQIWQLVLWSVLLLVGLFMSQDMCLWPAPAVLQYPSILLLSAGSLVFFVFLAAVAASCFYVSRSVWRWRERPAAVSNFLRAVVCLLFALGCVWISIWGGTRRTAAFARASTNGVPIIAALEQ